MIDNGLRTSGRRGTSFLRLEAIAQYLMQLQFDMLTASGVTVDKAWSDLSLYFANRIHYPNLMNKSMQNWADQVKAASGKDICANVKVHAEIIIFNNAEEASLHAIIPANASQTTCR